MILQTESLAQQAIERFWETIPPIWNHIRTNLRKLAMERCEISVEQFHVLRHISKGVCSVSDLAEVKQISRSAISQAVDILVARELVARRPDDADRRCITLELTPAGVEMLRAISQANRAWMAEKLAGLDEAALQSSLNALETLQATLGAALGAEK